MTLKTKYCPSCKQVKSASDFYLPPSRGHLTSQCKTCMAINSKSRIALWAKRHPEARQTNQRRYNLTPRGLYRRLKSSALQHHHPLNMTLTQFIAWLNQQPRICHYCGKILIPHGQNGDCQTIDRVNNNGAYELGNIVLACVSCNTKKGNKERTTAQPPKEASSVLSRQ